MVVVTKPAKVPDDALPWLYRTAWNVIMNHRRADARRAALPDRLPRGTRRRADPADVVADRERVLAALDALSDADREALLLVAWEGLDTHAADESRGLLGEHVHRPAPPRPPTARARAGRRRAGGAVVSEHRRPRTRTPAAFRGTPGRRPTKVTRPATARSRPCRRRSAEPSSPSAGAGAGRGGVGGRARRRRRAAGRAVGGRPCLRRTPCRALPRDADAAPDREQLVNGSWSVIGRHRVERLTGWLRCGPGSSVLDRRCDDGRVVGRVLRSAHAAVDVACRRADHAPLGAATGSLDGIRSSLVWGGDSPSSESCSTAAAYSTTQEDVDADPARSADGRRGPLTIWTGKELLVIGGDQCFDTGPPKVNGVIVQITCVPPSPSSRFGAAVRPSDAVSARRPAPVPLSAGVRCGRRARGDGCRAVRLRGWALHRDHHRLRPVCRPLAHGVRRRR